MDEKKPRPDDDTPETAEQPEAEKLSEKIPDKASGGATRRSAPPTSTPTPGPHGTG